MTIRDVDQLVEFGMRLVSKIRPHLSDEYQANQRQTLQNLCTRTTLSLPNTNDFDIKRGTLLELLVISQPDYPQLTEEERQASDYLLACMRQGRGLPRVGKSKRGLKNPDDLMTFLDENTLHITAIIEIKHNTAPHKLTFTRQLEGFEDSIRQVVEALQRRFQRRLQPPQNDTYPWPDTIRQIRLDPSFTRIIYLPSDRFKRLNGWEVRHSIFSKKEIDSLVNGKFWDQLVAKGGATTVKKEAEMAIHRSPFEGVAQGRIVTKEERNVTIGTVETRCLVIENDQSCQEPLPTDRDPFYVDREQKVPACDKHAVLSVNQQITEVVGDIRNALAETRPLDPSWDPTEVARDGQDQINKIKTLHLPARSFSLCVSVARDIRADIHVACVERLNRVTKENASKHQGNVFAGRILASVMDSEQARLRLQRVNARTRRTESYDLFRNAKTLCETSEKISEVVENLRQVDELIIEAKDAVKPHLTSDLGVMISTQIRNLQGNRDEFDHEGFYGRKDPVEISKSLVASAKIVLERATSLEDVLDRGRKFSELINAGDWDIGYGDPESVGAAIGEDKVAAIIDLVANGGNHSEPQAVKGAGDEDAVALKGGDTQTGAAVELEPADAMQEGGRVCSGEAHHPLDEGVEFCGQCAAPVQSLEPAKATPEPVAPDSETAEKPRFCSECGERNKATAKYCSNCGESLR